MTETALETRAGKAAIDGEKTVAGDILNGERFVAVSCLPVQGDHASKVTPRLHYSKAVFKVGTTVILKAFEDGVGSPLLDVGTS